MKPLTAQEHRQRPDGTWEVAYMTVPGQRARVLLTNAEYHAGSVVQTGRLLAERNQQAAPGTSVDLAAT